MKKGFIGKWIAGAGLVVWLGMLMVSCKKDNPIILTIPVNPGSGVVVLPADTGTDRRYLALGDSYTIGQSVDSAGRFPAQTAALLAQKGVVFSQIQYIATTGWTTLDLMQAINITQPKGPFFAVTLLIGVNDQYQSHDTTNYRSRFTALLDTAIFLSGSRRSHVFVLSIPDYGVTPFGGNRPEISTQIDEFNTINKAVTQQYGISYTDVTVISRADAGDATAVASDGLHPSAKQYAQWSQALMPAMLNALQ